MILRIWVVRLTPGKAVDLEAFTSDFSLPMFKAQPGCLAVFFTRTDTECTVVTVWDSERSVETMEASPLYQKVVSQVEDSGILNRGHHTQVFSVYGGFIGAELARELSAGVPTPQSAERQNAMLRRRLS